jgi:hypothetical protein
MQLNSCRNYSTIFTYDGSCSSFGGGKTLTAIGLSASTKNAELEESNPEMGLAKRVINANNAGIIEATTGHLFTGASGAVMKKS